MVSNNMKHLKNVSHVNGFTSHRLASVSVRYHYRESSGIVYMYVQNDNLVTHVAIQAEFVVRFSSFLL